MDGDLDLNSIFLVIIKIYIRVVSSKIKLLIIIRVVLVWIDMHQISCLLIKIRLIYLHVSRRLVAH